MMRLTDAFICMNLYNQRHLFALVTCYLGYVLLLIYDTYSTGESRIKSNRNDNTGCLLERDALMFSPQTCLMAGQWKVSGRYWINFSILTARPCVAIKAALIDLLLVHTLLPSLNDSRSLQPVTIVSERKSRMFHALL